jgi:hypothetical protein
LSRVRERQDVRKAGAVAALGGAAIVLPFAAPADAMPAACACGGGGGAAPAPDPKPSEHQGLAPVPHAAPPAPVQPEPPPPPPDPKPFEHQALQSVEPAPAPEPQPPPPPRDPKPFEHQALQSVEPAPAPEPQPPPPPRDPKPFEHQALRPEPEPAPPPRDPKPFEHQALQSIEPTPSEPPPPPPRDPKPFEHQALRPAPEPEPAPPPRDPKPFEHQALQSVEPTPAPKPEAPAPDPKPHEHLGLAPTPPADPKPGEHLGLAPTPPVDPKPFEHQALAPTPPVDPKPFEHQALAPTPPVDPKPFEHQALAPTPPVDPKPFEHLALAPGIGDPTEPLPPEVTVEEPVEVAPQTDENYFEPWTRVGMTEDEWRDLEDEVLDEACPSGWQGVVFGCSVAGLTLNEEGELEPIEILENGVGSALGRLARWASGAKALPSVGRALTSVSTRIPLSLKNTLVARGVLQSPATRLPAYSGGRTHGIVDFGFEEVARVSGRAGPAASMPRGSRGFDAYFRTHVEGHAVAEMIQRNIPRATVYINQAAPCAGTCMRMIPRALPAGYELRVVGSTGRVYTFTGTG